MISGNQPLKAITYVADLQLFWAVFSLPLDVEPPIPTSCDKYLPYLKWTLFCFILVLFLFSFGY